MPEKARREFSGQVLDQSVRMERLVERMLELSKLEHQDAVVGKQHVEVRQFLETCVRNATASQDHPIELDVSPANASLLAEPDLLELALGNLLDNARAFSPPGSVIRIEAQAGVIAVQDSGPGVADYALERVGQRFFSTVRPDGRTKGSGLGLAIVRQIMLLHGGSMEVANTQPGWRVELHFPG